MNADDIIHLLNIVGDMIDGKEHEDLNLIWDYLTYMLSKLEEE